MFHVVAVHPVGMREDAEEAVILQSVHDIPDGSGNKLILVDIELHFHPVRPGHNSLTAASRKGVRVPPHMHRGQLLRMQGLWEYCHVLERHNINHGDYVRIQVQTPEDLQIDTEVAIHAARESALTTQRSCGRRTNALSLMQHSVEIFHTERSTILSAPLFPSNTLELIPQSFLLRPLRPQATLHPHKAAGPFIRQDFSSSVNIMGGFCD